MKISKAWEEMILDKQLQGVTPNTLENYNNLWRVFSQFLEREKITTVEELNPRVYKKFIHEYVQKGNKPSSINTKIKILKVFARWMQEEEITKGDTSKGLKLMREDQGAKIISEEVVKQVLSHLRRQRRRGCFYGTRNHSIVVTLMGTGLRASELCSLNWEDIDFKEQLITIRKSKSRSLQSIPLSESVAKELVRHRLFMERVFKKVPTPVFTSIHGKRLTRNALRLIFRKLREELGISGSFTPHRMRNVFIKSLLKNKANLREVQLLARHTKIEVTKRYAGYFSHELKDILDEYDPLKGLT